MSSTENLESLSLDDWNIGYEVVDRICEALPPPAVLLEFGSGRGTQLLLDAGYDVHSVEHQVQFARMGTTTCLAPIVGDWYCHRQVSGFLNRVQPRIVLVDGPPGDIGRLGILRHVGQLACAELWVIDDTDREDEKILAAAICNQLRLVSATFEYANKQFSLLRTPF